MGLEEASNALTDFTVGPLGFCEWEQMPFGLMNVLATFQCLIETCLGDLQFQWCIIYLDDIISFAATPKKNLKRLHTVLSQLWVAGLKLQSTKCKFFQPCVVYLGHEISKEGIWTDGHKVIAIKNWPIPAIVTKLQNFLGLTNYYRCFIKGYARVTCSLYDQMSGDNAAHKKKKFSAQRNAKKPLICWR